MSTGRRSLMIVLGIGLCAVLALAATRRVNGLWSLRSPTEGAGRWVLAPGAVLERSTASFLRITRPGSTEHARTGWTAVEGDRSAALRTLGHVMAARSQGQRQSFLLVAVPATRGPPAVLAS